MAKARTFIDVRLYVETPAASADEAMRDIRADTISGPNRTLIDDFSVLGYGLEAGDGTRLDWLDPEGWSNGKERAE